MRTHPGQRRPAALTLALAASLSVVGVAGCSSSASSSKSAAATASASANESNPAAVVKPLTVLVMNDDGYNAPGIDAVVQALRKEPALTIKVVAPDKNNSGAGGKVSTGPVTYDDAKTRSGYPAVSVHGTPADAANVAFDQLHLTPDVVISGANAGQNLGPLIDISGTVGAARVAARHGVPSLAVSAGFVKYDFATAAGYAIDWFRRERPSLPRAATSTPGILDGLNVPSCTAGKVRGELVLAVQTALLPGQSPLAAQDCTATVKPTTEVAAFNAGFATLVHLPLNPK